MIECFDISNHGTDYAVGAMSRLVDGVPDRSGYRKFRIRTVRGRDDFAMIAEVVRRRYARLLKSDSEMPDLVLVDGGLGQLGAALGSIEDLGIGLACASLAKREEEVFVPGSSIPVPLERAGRASSACSTPVTRHTGSALPTTGASGAGSSESNFQSPAERQADSLWIACHGAFV